jgi:hypothetical protein
VDEAIVLSRNRARGKAAETGGEVGRMSLSMADPV